MTSTSTKTRFRYVGRHAHNVHLAEGESTMVGPGMFVELTDDEVKLNQDAVNDGTLIDASPPVVKTPTASKVKGNENE